MAGALILGFLLAFAVCGWAIVDVGFVQRGGRKWGFALLAIAMLALVAAWWSTFRYVYFADANTRLHGWPVPCIVFQRDTTDGPWRDYVGPTVLFALPMNFSLYFLPFAIVFLAVAYVRIGIRAMR